MTALVTPDHDPYAAALAAAVATEFGGDDEHTVVRHTQDVAPILDANKHDHNHVSGWSPTRDLRHVARIPLVVAMIWLNRYGVDALNRDHRDAVARLLNSSEWSYLRTGGGHIGRR